jgi:hypothetical protein
VGPLPPLSWLVPPQNGALTQLEPPLAKSTYDVKTEEGNEYTIRDAADPHLDGRANPQHIRVLADNLDPENASRREKRTPIACERHVLEFPLQMDAGQVAEEL